MNIRRSSILSIVLLGVMVFSLLGDVTTVFAANACPAASFVADVTIPDGTYINPGTNFNKVWRIKNVGLCAWNTGYSLVFVSGERMGGLSPIFLTRYVGVNQTYDFSVDLVAPTSGGTFRGYWALQTDKGTQFGIGAGFRNPFWVEIRVLAPTSTAVAYDFVANMCAGQWGYDGGPIPCPTNPSKKDFGYVETLANPIMENGAAAGAPALLTIPQNKFDGAIHGAFPVDDIFTGDHFQATIGCQNGAFNCDVIYQIDYLQNSSMVTLWRFKERYDGLFYQVDLDLSPIANRKNAQLVLSIYANGPNVGDQPLWVSPRIVRSVITPQPTPIPPTPTPPIILTSTPTTTPGAATSTPTPGVGTATPTPQTNCTDRAQFITDVTIPDGTTLRPYQPFNKVWRLKNVGTCTWTGSYKAAFVSGAPMGGVDTPLTQNTFPGQTVDVAVNLVAPGVAGSYRGYWEFKNAYGTLFGIGSSASSAWWVDIRVSGTPFATPTPTNQPATATPTTVSAATSTPTPTSASAATSTATPTGAPVATATQTPTSTPTAVPPTATPTAIPVTPTPTLVGSGWQLYQNTKYGFAFQIPPGSVITSKFDNGGHVLLPFTSGTNLVEKYMDVTVAENASSCKSIYSNSMSQASAQTVTINGIQFLLESSTEGAVGNVYDWTGYSTFKGTTCISLSFVLHSTNPGAYPTPPPLFDKAAESAVFSTIMSSFGYQ